MAVLRLPDAAARKFVAVDCGARGSSWPPHIRAAFPSANLLGFDPDADACRDFERDLAPNARAFCVAVGETDGTATIHLTHNPACSSLLAPDHMYFGRFADIGDAVTPIETKQVPVVRLDTFLVALDVHSADYMHLDVQGAELDVLRGARCLLETTLALQVEVEFSRIYHDQPLFADVDSFLRARGFALFGLERQAVLRRAVLPSEVPTRGQLMWAHAVYLRAPATLAADSRGMLASLASALGYHDYAVEVAADLPDLRDALGIYLRDLHLSDYEVAKETYATRGRTEGTE